MNSDHLYITCRVSGARILLGPLLTPRATGWAVRSLDRAKPGDYFFREASFVLASLPIIAVSAANSL